MGRRRIDVRIPYRPRPPQAQIHKLLDEHRAVVAVCHRRMGKTVAAVNHLVKSTCQCRHERPRYAYIAPLYRQAKQVAWDYVKHYSAPFSAVGDVRALESELRVDLPWGARIQLFGADNPDALRGSYWDGVVLDEYAQMPATLWGEVVRPALADRKGWALFMGTPKGRNAFWELWRDAGKREGWARVMHRASETGLLSDEELRAARADMSEAEYQQEFECSFQAAIVGAYYGAAIEQMERDGRIGSVTYDRGEPVYTGWDLGMADATAIWCAQAVGQELHLIDYVEDAGVALDEYVRRLQALGYVYGGHVLPHDAKARELGTGQSRLEVLERLGLRVVIAPRLSVQDGIEAVRRKLPQTWIDAERCHRGIEALRLYRREWDARGGMFRSRPVHDWTSHAADALRYLVTGLDAVRTQSLDVIPEMTVSIPLGDNAWML